MPSPGDGAKGLQWRGGDEHSGDHNRHGANDRCYRPLRPGTTGKYREPSRERREDEPGDECSWTAEGQADSYLCDAECGGGGAEQPNRLPNLIPLGCLIRVEWCPSQLLTLRPCRSCRWSHAMGAGAGGPSR